MAVYDSGNGGIYSIQNMAMIMNQESLKKLKNFCDFAPITTPTTELKPLMTLKFAGGDQWPVEIQNSRLLESRPYLTINKIDAYCRQIANSKASNGLA